MLAVIYNIAYKRNSLRLFPNNIAAFVSEGVSLDIMCILDFSQFPRFETDRLKLRQLHIVDAEGILALRSEGSLAGGSGMEYIDQANSYIDKINAGISADEWVFWSIVLKQTKTFIGTVSIWNIDKETGTGELGYELLTAFQRNGYMSEALSPVISYAFDRMKLSRLEAYTREDNEPSVKLLLNNGFSRIQKETCQQGFSVFQLVP